jgi:hypothetical protein
MAVVSGNIGVSCESNSRVVMTHKRMVKSVVVSVVIVLGLGVAKATQPRRKRPMMFNVDPAY